MVHTLLSYISVRRGHLLLGAAVAVLGACQVENPINLQDPGSGVRFGDCDLNTDYMIAAAARNGIQSIDAPIWEVASQTVPDYLDPDTRVVGIQAFGLAYAIPHNVLWWHEVVNLDPGGPNGPRMAVTYCPLTGSALVFDRGAVGGATLGVSGIVFMNNLVLFDRSGDDESLWPQLWGEARCGVQTGADLGRFAFVEMEWADWLELHPDTRVLASIQDVDRDLGPNGTLDYAAIHYPYGNYRTTEAFWRERTAMPPLDRRRFTKERVIGLPETQNDPGIAFPFGALTERNGSHLVVDFDYEGQAAIVLWDDDAQGGATYRPVTEAGQVLTLMATDSGFEDLETGSEWTVEGDAVSGLLAGERLVPIASTHTAFWSAHAAFHPQTRLWE